MYLRSSDSRDSRTPTKNANLIWTIATTTRSTAVWAPVVDLSVRDPRAFGSKGFTLTLLTIRADVVTTVRAEPATNLFSRMPSSVIQHSLPVSLSNAFTMRLIAALIVCNSPCSSSRIF